MIEGTGCQSLASMRADSFKITAIIAAYNEADIIGCVVADLIDQGIHVLVMNHGSTDGTRGVLEPFVRRGCLVVEDFPEPGTEDLMSHRFSLRRIIERKQELATQLGSTWFINHDADEFRESPWSGVTLFEGIRQVDALGYNAIDFQVYNFWPTRDDFKPGDDPRVAFPYYDRPGAWDKLQIRCWKKIDGPFDLVSSAGHEAIFPGRQVFPIRFLLRHYPFRSQAHGLRKLFEERRPRYDEEERREGWHIQYDRMTAGARFLRDPSELQLFDGTLERIWLQVNHRHVEVLERDLDAVRLAEAGAAREVQLLRNELDDRNREVGRLQAALHDQHLETERLGMPRISK